jgi:hypothetical protein
MNASNSKDCIPEKIQPYHELELNEIFARTREYTSLRAKAFVFAGGVNASLIFFAVEHKSEWGFIIGAFVLAPLIFVDKLLRTRLNGLYSRGLRLEDIYATDSTEAFIHTDVELAEDQTGEYQLINISNVRDEKVRLQRIKELASPFRSRIAKFAIVIGVIELLLGALFLAWKIGLHLNFLVWQLNI